MKNILFDLYGTLIDVRTDEESGAFWQEVSKLLLHMKERGGELKERYASLCFLQKEKLPPLAEIDLLAVFRALLRECGLPDSRAEEFAVQFRKLSLRRCRPFRGAKKLLAELRARGAGVYLLSNAQACFTRAEISACGLTPYFNGVLLSSEAGWKKPSPQFFEAAFSRFSLAPEHCLYVGNDLRDDVGGAHGVGMKCVYIHTKQSGKYDDAPEPDLIAENHKNLLQILTKECVDA